MMNLKFGLVIIVISLMFLTACSNSGNSTLKTYTLDQLECVPETGNARSEFIGDLSQKGTDGRFIDDEFEAKVKNLEPVGAKFTLVIVCQTADGSEFFSSSQQFLQPGEEKKFVITPSTDRKEWTCTKSDIKGEAISHYSVQPKADVD